MNKKTVTPLSLEDRKKIELGIVEGLSKSQIAKRINRKSFYKKNSDIHTGYLIELFNTKQYSNGSMKPTIRKQTVESLPDKS